MKINKTNCIKLFLFLTLSFSASNCKRYSKAENEMKMEEKSTITKLEVQNILNSKVNLVNYSEPNKYSISIPDNYKAETIEYSDGQIELKFGKLESTSRKNIIEIKLEPFITGYNNLSNQSVLIVQESNPDLLTIEDIKKDLKTDNSTIPIYYEDTNSIIYGENPQIICFGYDSVLKKYSVYQGIVNGFGDDLTQEEKLNLAMHMLKNGKNLFKKGYKNSPFTSWEQYVNNTPMAEINLIAKPYNNVTKEIKYFLDSDDQIYIPNSDAKLYQVNLDMHIRYLNVLNAIRLNKFPDFDFSDSNLNNFENTFFEFKTNNKYSLTQIENIDIIKINNPDYESTTQILICHIESGGKYFYIISKDVSEFTKDFYIKMLNYFAKNKTLEVPLSKN